MVGGGWCVWQDLSQIDWQSHHIMCVNDIYMHFPGEVHHHYSNCWQALQHWTAARVDRFRNQFTRTTLRHSNRGDGAILWPWTGHGTSGLNAVLTGLALGYDKLILAGMPLDNGGHYYDPRPTECVGSFGNHRFSNFEIEIPTKANKIKYWDDAKSIFNGKVKSLSGRTKTLLGGP